MRLSFSPKIAKRMDPKRRKLFVAKLTRTWPAADLPPIQPVGAALKQLSGYRSRAIVRIRRNFEVFPAESQ